MINRDFKPKLETKSRSKKPWLASAALLSFISLSAVGAYGLLDGDEPGSTQSKTISLKSPSASIALALPKVDDSADAESLKAVIVDAEPSIADAKPEPTFEWSTHAIQSGDNLAKVFSSKGLSARTLYDIMHASDDASALKHVKPGHELRFAIDSDDQLQSLTYNIDQTTQLVVNRTPLGFDAQIEEKPVESIATTAASQIQDSLFLDGKDAGLSDKTLMELANIFGWDIDFALDLREGDSFALVYEARYLEGQRIKDGPILAAEFINQGKTYRAIRYTDANGHSEYFSPEGKSMRKTFLRTPIELARISSGFNLKRKHPVLNRVRAHKGVDYAAGTGTPIRVTGDGKVVFRGVKGGYGRVVVVQHGQKYSTLYAHMSKYGKYGKGTSVKQGQIIGYVGKSGLATGPHLHYEFRVNGVHQNPLKVSFPAASPIHKELLADFQKQSELLLAKLDTAKQPVLAQNQR